MINISHLSINSIPGIPPINGNNKIQPDPSSTLLEDTVGSFVPTVIKFHYWGIIIITAVFVIGALVMILSALFKNGQWQKYGQTSMFFSFIIMLVWRGGPILALSIRNTTDVDTLLQDFIITLSYSAIFLGAISIATSILFRFGYNLIEHPEFHRRSKALVMVSVLMMIFAIAIPKLFPLI